jgi:hypothetical protein
MFVAVDVNEVKRFTTTVETELGEIEVMSELFSSCSVGNG